LAGVDGFMKGGEISKMTPGVVVPPSLERTATSKRSAAVAAKPSPVTTDDKRNSLPSVRKLYERYSLKM